MHPVRFPEPRTQARLRTEVVAVCREFAQQSQSHRRAPKRNDLDHCGQRLLRSYLVKIRCHQVSNQLRHSSCLTSNRVVFEIVSSVATLASMARSGVRTEEREVRRQAEPSSADEAAIHLSGRSTPSSRIMSSAKVGIDRVVCTTKSALYRCSTR